MKTLYLCNILKSRHFISSSEHNNERFRGLRQNPVVLCSGMEVPHLAAVTLLGGRENHTAKDHIHLI